LTGSEADELISGGQIELDGKIIFENVLLQPEVEIRAGAKVIRKKKEYRYFRFYKPRGFLSTLNPKVEGNLTQYFDQEVKLAIAGRLDKESEGLLLLSDNGKWVEAICHPAKEKEKEYIVTLDKPPGEADILRLSSGVKIGGYLTKPCRCWQTGAFQFGIILQEGKYRQIRRMCFQLGFQVVHLKRIRIASETLGALQPGEIQEFRINT
jgi:23S rRNA pseudouridine2604 synthase